MATWTEDWKNTQGILPFRGGSTKLPRTDSWKGQRRTDKNFYSSQGRQRKGKFHGWARTIPECPTKQPSSTRISISFTPTLSTKISSNQEPLSQLTGKEKIWHRSANQLFPRDMLIMAPKTTRGFSHAEIRVRRAAIGKKPLSLFRHGRKALAHQTEHTLYHS